MTARDAGAIASRALAVITFLSAGRLVLFAPMVGHDTPASLMWFGMTGLFIAIAGLLWFQAGRFYAPYKDTEHAGPINALDLFHLSLAVLGLFLMITGGFNLVSDLIVMSLDESFQRHFVGNARAEALSHGLSTLMGAGLLFWNRGRFAR